MKQNLKPHFRAALKPEGVLELSVYEEIGENFWTGGGVTALNVKEQLESAKSYDRIAVRINSPGGDAFEGVAIRSVLRSTKKPIDVYIDGIAASAASILAMAGDTITMAPGSMMMIHDAWSMCVGNGEDMRKMADTLERVSASIAQVYAERTGMPVADVSALMDEETWMNAEQAVKAGFATHVSAHENASAMALAASFKCLAKLKHLPEELKASSDNEPTQEEPAVHVEETPGDGTGTPSPEQEKEEAVDGSAEKTAEATEAPVLVETPIVPTAAAPVPEPVVEIKPVVEEPTNLSQYEARLKFLRAA
jgi:ATP-dependent Clp protease protease subunit